MRVRGTTGRTYERSEIKRWLRTHNTDPNTNSRLPSKRLVENVTLRKLCQEWRDKHKV